MTLLNDNFFKYLAQTSDNPIGLKIQKADGCYITDTSGEKYLDLVAGFSVMNIGHNHPEIKKSIIEQASNYLHVMVYGEFILEKQVKYAQKIVSLLPPSLSNVYFVNSGAEAIEGALKLSKCYTHRSEIICFKNAYHGSTQGALSIMGNEQLKISFRPLIPDIKILEFNNLDIINQITDKTACVFIEPIQAEAGVQLPATDFLQKLRERCNQTQSLLVFDEVQTGFGRTGSLFALNEYQVIPDILVLGKALGGGMPLGAFVSSKKIMSQLMNNPALGHITTFGGHPVSCAAGLASLEIILKDKLDKQAKEKEKLIKKYLHHRKIKTIRIKGLLCAVEVDHQLKIRQIIDEGLKRNILLEGFLFNENAFRITPPLTISEDEIKIACKAICSILDSI